MNEKAHWDNIATRYNEEIFDVFKSDRDKAIGSLFPETLKSSNTTPSILDVELEKHFNICHLHSKQFMR